MLVQLRQRAEAWDRELHGEALEVEEVGRDEAIEGREREGGKGGVMGLGERSLYTRTRP